MKRELVPNLTCDAIILFNQILILIRIMQAPFARSSFAVALEYDTRRCAPHTPGDPDIAVMGQITYGLPN